MSRECPIMTGPMNSGFEKKRLIGKGRHMVERVVLCDIPLWHGTYEKGCPDENRLRDFTL